ncbi:MAG: energy transducer TonB [bacterium]
MKRVVIGLVASVLIHAVLLQVAMSEPKNQFKVNVNSGKMSMALKRQVKKDVSKKEETEKEKKEETRPEPKPDPTKKQATEKKPEKKKEQQKDKRKKQTQKDVDKEKKQEQPASKKRRGAEWVKKADYRSNPSPDYPPRARRLGHEGTVVLKVLVDKQGQPESVSIKNSSGYNRLDEAALKTVREWEFTPASTAGVPVKSTVLVPVRYQLEE